jgi:hypothetical protein
VSATLQKILRVAEEAGRLLPEDLDLVEIQIEGGSIVPRDEAKDAGVHQIYAALGVMSPQTITQRLDLDFEQEQTNILAAKKKDGPEAMAEPDKLATAGGLIDPPASAPAPPSKPEAAPPVNGKHESFANGIRDELLEAFRRVIPANPPAIEINVPPPSVTVEAPPPQPAPVVIVEGDRLPAPAFKNAIHAIHRNADGQIVRIEGEDGQGRYERIFDRDETGLVTSMREERV